MRTLTSVLILAALALSVCVRGAAQDAPPVLITILPGAERCAIGQTETNCNGVGVYVRDVLKVKPEQPIWIMVVVQTRNERTLAVKQDVERAGFKSVTVKVAFESAAPPK